MTETSVNYGKVLFSLHLNDETITKSKELLQSKELVEALSNPAVRRREKEAVIAKLFPEEIRSYINVVCLNECMDLFDDIFAAYEEIKLEAENTLKATFTYVYKPDDEELNAIKQMLMTKYKKQDVKFELKEDASLLGGFVLKVGDMEYDKSIKGTLELLQKNLVRR
ncbi:ATP synthase delta chain [Lachnospiraceae bacterium KM106-2]|nr:ATP synthase delta chain [Lachnospiraceae bacterium KM106-2]